MDTVFWHSAVCGGKPFDIGQLVKRSPPLRVNPKPCVPILTLYGPLNTDVGNRGEAYTVDLRKRSGSSRRLTSLITG